MQDQKVFIIGGGGMVGATAAYALAIREIVQEIVLIDIDKELVEGQAMDINDAMGFADGVEVRTGTYDEIATDDIVVITGGAAQKPGQTRLELLDINAGIIRDIVGKIVAGNAEPFIVLVTNPVDVLTHVALKASGLPKNKVFGTGTTLDTARLRVALAQKLAVSENEISAYVMGEHGDSSFSAMSGATVAGVYLDKIPAFTPELIGNTTQEIRDRVYKIIDAKKSTYFGIGQVIAEIVDAMIHNVSSVFPVCSLVEGEYGLHDTVVGLPSLISADGVKILEGYHLSDQEHEQLKKSAGIVREAIEQTK